MDMAKDTLHRITDDLVGEISRLQFGPPVTHIYNPLIYARPAWDLYLERYGGRPREVVLLGMNPGPWGMAQTGVPFGEVTAVREFLGIETEVGQPQDIHPKRPVNGFDCTRSEVSGQRVWGWVRKTFGSPDRFFPRFFIGNYCPLLFIDKDGRNRTPGNLRTADRSPLEAVCNRALQRTAAYFEAKFVVGFGAYAAQRAEAALEKLDVRVGRITHPSPANPKANRGWEDRVVSELKQMGIGL
jgi:single-strand selective monofunctional uracil DNA glycosylase